VSDIVEVLGKDPIKLDEKFYGLKFEGIEYVFQISEENTWEGDWVYRIYHFNTKDWKRIDNLEFEKIKTIMRHTAMLHNSGSFLSSELNTKELMEIWKTHFTVLDVI